MLNRIGRFGLVGVAATATYYVASLALAHIVDVFWASTLGYGVAMLVSYYGHHRITFAAQRDKAAHRRAVSRFVGSSALGLSTTQLILYVATSLCHFPPWLGLGVVVIVVPILTFLLCHFWVFSPPAGNQDKSSPARPW